MRFLSILGVSLALLVHVPTDDHAAAAEARKWDGTVQVHGALRAMFHEGKTDSTVGLESLLPDPDLYAIGALADLAGEVTVIAGRAYLAIPETANEARTEMALESDADAALLVSAAVPEWKSLVIDHPIPFEQLDDEIGKLAVAAGLNVEGRLPFLLEGTFDDLQWHVIDGRRLTEGGSSHQDHLSAAVLASRDRTVATLIGFYSQRDQGVFTHMGSKTHLHCVIEEPLSSGHVDHVSISAGTTIKFPRRS
jgi:acetolactate decarboxylase